MLFIPALSSIEGTIDDFRVIADLKIWEAKLDMLFGFLLSFILLSKPACRRHAFSFAPPLCQPAILGPGWAWDSVFRLQVQFGSPIKSRPQVCLSQWEQQHFDPCLYSLFCALSCLEPRWEHRVRFIGGFFGDLMVPLIFPVLLHVLSSVFPNCW